MSRPAFVRMRGGSSRLYAALRRLKSPVFAGQSRYTRNSEEPWSLPVVPRLRRRAMLDVVRTALVTRGVAFRAGLTESNAYIGIAESEIDRACEAIVDLARQCHPSLLYAWYGTGVSYDSVRVVTSLSVDNVRNCDSLVIGVPYSYRRLEIGREGGVEILLLERRDARLVPRRRCAQLVDWTSIETADGNSPGASSIADHMSTHVLAREPIDIVYTWVDSSDPKWCAARAAWTKKQDKWLDSSGNEERFLDRNELRYSLRSVWLYAPFVRRIFIVTAGHRPAWLRSDDDRIVVVSHDEIFPDPSDLPTFNSHAIEACLHRISDLSEHFIYFNDDVFLGREVTVETFYTRGGLIKSRLSPRALTALSEPGPFAIPTDWASYNATRLMRRDFGLSFERKMAHVPMPLKRSLLWELEERYSEEFAATRAARFRAASDLSVPSMFAHYYAIATGKAVEWSVNEAEYAYADSGRSDFESRLEAIAHREPTFFCLNVTRHSDIELDRQRELLHSYLGDRYPIPSPFEQ